MNNVINEIIFTSGHSCKMELCSIYLSNCGHFFFIFSKFCTTGPWDTWNEPILRMLRVLPRGWQYNQDLPYFLTIFFTVDDDNMYISWKIFQIPADQFRNNSEIIQALVSFSTDRVRPHLYSPLVWSHHIGCNWKRCMFPSCTIQHSTRSSLRSYV